MAPFWQSLFAPGNPSRTAAVTMKLLKKRGQPLLLLPCQPDLATRGLDLYPAQTPRSRLARSLARWILVSRLPLGVETVQVSVSLDDPFVRWLHSLAQLPEKQIPQFAVLAGNPNSPGQRLITLLFGANGQPVAVVKTGLTGAAKALIEQERKFFEEVPRTFKAIPAPRGSFANERLQALALDFLPGHSPRLQDERSLPEVLSQWLHPSLQVSFANTRVGCELASVCSNDALFKTQMQQLQHCSFRAAVYHGDFTPWNIRVSSQGAWTVLDWERGEVNGLPAWDWFHYAVQKNILVQHQSAEAVAASLEGLLASDQFKTYARDSGVTGAERALLLLYLLHHTEVIRPSEGLRATKDLIQLLSARWR